MTRALSSADAGATVEIDVVPDDTTRARLLRLGFLDGPVECRRRVRNGPVLLRRNGTDIAIGKPIADEITVKDSSQ
jgi:Fe2+ transport system protein FeoA